MQSRDIVKYMTDVGVQLDSLDKQVKAHSDRVQVVESASNEKGTRLLGHRQRVEYEATSAREYLEKLQAQMTQLRLEPASGIGGGVSQSIQSRVFDVGAFVVYDHRSPAFFYDCLWMRCCC